MAGCEGEKRTKVLPPLRNEHRPTAKRKNTLHKERGRVWITKKVRPNTSRSKVDIILAGGRSLSTLQRKSKKSHGHGRETTSKNAKSKKKTERSGIFRAGRLKDSKKTLSHTRSRKEASRYTIEQMRKPFRPAAGEMQTHLTKYQKKRHIKQDEDARCMKNEQHLSTLNMVMTERRARSEGKKEERAGILPTNVRSQKAPQQRRVKKKKVQNGTEKTPEMKKGGQTRQLSFKVEESWMVSNDNHESPYCPCGRSMCRKQRRQRTAVATVRKKLQTTISYAGRRGNKSCRRTTQSRKKVKKEVNAGRHC